MRLGKNSIPSKELIKLNEVQVHKLNLSALEKESCMAFLISFIILCISFFFTTPLWEEYRLHALLLSSVSLAVFLLCTFSKRLLLHCSTIIAYVYSCFLLFYFSVFHFFSNAAIPSICFYCLLILMPIIFFSYPLLLYTILGIFSVFYICLARVSLDPYFTITHINTVCVFFCSFLLSIQLQNTKLKTIEKGRIIEEQRDTDLLTGLPNRTKLMHEFEKASLSNEKNTISGIFMIDIDFFKKFNDTYGHYAGDKCLKVVGSCLLSFSKRNDVDFFRYGGEEFLAIVRGKQSQIDYDETAKKLISEIHNLKIPCNSGVDPFVTISAGYATQNGDASLSIGELISRADWALYQSKNNGRNRASAWKETAESLAQIKPPAYSFENACKPIYRSPWTTKVAELRKITAFLKSNRENAAIANIRAMILVFSVIVCIASVLLLVSIISRNVLWRPYRLPYGYLFGASLISLLLSLFYLPKHKTKSFVISRVLVFINIPFIFYERFFTNSGATDFPFLLFCIFYTTLFIDNRIFISISLFMISALFAAMRIYFLGFSGTAFFSIAFAVIVSIIAGDSSCYTKLSLYENNRLEKKQRDTDILTGLPNRRKLYEELAKSDEIAAVYMVDIDFFKKYNDTFGHQSGDDCLRRIGEALTSASLLTGIDFFRYGGEEFTGILRNKNMHGYTVSIENYRYGANAQIILNEVRSLNIPFNSSVAQMVTLSCGFAVAHTDRHYSPETLIELADEALYRAKEHGRNQAVAFTQK